MKQKLIAALTLIAAVSSAAANTYVVSAEGDDTPKLSATHLAGSGCMYADKAVAVGDTLVIEGTETVLVCANAAQGTVFYPLSAAGGRRVVKSLPSNSGASSNGEASYKMTATSAPSFTPVKAWNDGQSTFIELAAGFHADLPVVLALAEDGSRSLVNFYWDQMNSRFVVQRVLDRAILVLDDKSVVVSRL